MNFKSAFNSICILAMVVTLACEEVPRKESLQNSFDWDFSYEKSTVSNEILFQVELWVPTTTTITNDNLFFSSGDGSDTTHFAPSTIVEESDLIYRHYQIGHTYPGSGAFRVIFWLDEFALQKLEGDVLIDPL